jgi:hypothetical protein
MREPRAQKHEFGMRVCRLRDSREVQLAFLIAPHTGVRCWLLDLVFFYTGLTNLFRQQQEKIGIHAC